MDGVFRCFAKGPGLGGADCREGPQTPKRGIQKSNRERLWVIEKKLKQKKFFLDFGLSGLAS